MPHLALFNCGLAICFGFITSTPMNFLIAALWLFLGVSWLRNRRFSRR